MRLSSCDTNILLHALNSNSPYHDLASRFVASHAHDENFRICELVLIELYVLLRNPAVLTSPLSAGKAVEVCNRLRTHPVWGVVDYPGPMAKIMERVWTSASDEAFARRRIFDARLAHTLLHYGVSQFYTQNVKDFQGFGFDAVSDPLS